MKGRNAHFLGAALITLMASCGGSKSLTGDGSGERSATDFHALLLENRDTTVSYEFTGNATYRNGTSSQSFRYNLRILRDSLIWMDISDPFLGLKVARILIMPDSAVIYNRFDRTWMAGGVSIIQERLKMGLEFNHLQRMLLAEPLYVSPSADDITLSADSLLMRATVLGTIPDKLFRFDTARYHYEFVNLRTFPLSRQELPDGPREMVINYTYDPGDLSLPKSIDLKLKWKTESGLELRHSQIMRDVTPHLPFTIPDGYERIH